MMPGKQMNGVSPRRGAGDTSFVNFDPDDPEYVRDLQRPAVIKEDMNEMERRKRVREILESKPFRTELEQLIIQEKEKGNNPDNLKTLEQLSELILPRGQLTAATLHGMSSQAIVPICDLRGGEATKYSKQERILRNKLAALYRLLDLFQWSQGIYNHVTLRLGAESDEFLINPFGLLYHEVQASSLIKVDGEGRVLDQGSTGMGINEAGFVLHSTIHKARPHARCVVHLHTPVVGAVAAMKCGLLPICQEAMIVGPVSYHDFQGIVSDPSERESIIDDLNQKPDSKVMLLRNHGFVAIGDTVEDAFHLAFHTVIAAETQVIFLRGDGFLTVGDSVEEAFHLARCLIQASEQQIRAARAGIENLVIPSEDAQKKCFETANQGGGGVLRSPTKEGAPHGVRWRVGELEWEAWMRVLDNAGFRTGHIYRQPLLRGKGASSAPPQSDVEVPPAASSYGVLDEMDAGSAAAQKLDAMRRDQERTRWLNSPNVYQKVEFLETGTSDPKKITKWVQDATSPVHSTPVKITDGTHQFSPLSINSKEFKDKQKAIKEQRRAGEISAGPRSHVLEGVTYEDLSIKDADLSGASDKIVTIGTASKGIIERDFQHNAQVYRQLYAPNPFASETDEDIQKYMKEVQQKRPVQPQGDKPASPTETESPCAETVSLMMAARDHRPAQAVDEDPPLPQPTTATNRTSGKGYTRETTFDPQTNQATSRITEKKQPSSIGGWFQRSKSARLNRTHHSPVAGADAKAASDDELQGEGKSPKKKEKKKKFKTPSFLRSKKDKKKHKEGISDEEEE